MIQVLSIGLFDGIGALRVGLDLLAAPVCGHISAERRQRVVEAQFPDSWLVTDIDDIDFSMVKAWALRWSLWGLSPWSGGIRLECRQKGSPP